jgi:hypothetical protein
VSLPAELAARQNVDDEENVVGMVHGSISKQKTVTCLSVPHATVWQILDFEGLHIVAFPLKSEIV